MISTKILGISTASSFNVGISDNLTLFFLQNDAEFAIRGGILAIDCSGVSISGFSLIISVVIL
jgi:hypothetical protein